MLAECESRYSRVMQEETGREYSTRLSVNTEHFLTDAEGGSCGGVFLTALNGKIVCPNTLIDRLNLCFEQELPQIRKGLFPNK